MNKTNILFSFVEEYIRHYNKETGSSIVVSNDYCTEFLPYIENDTEILHFENACVILLALYYFGTPSLFHKYCVARKLLDSGYYDKADELISALCKEFENTKQSFIALLSCNPEWIECEVGIIISHEIGHHLYKRDAKFCESIKGQVNAYIENFDKINHSYNPIKRAISWCNKRRLKRFGKDEDFIEELVADVFAFYRFSDICSNLNKLVSPHCLQTNAYPIIMAAISGSRYFGEYVATVKRIYHSSTENHEIRRLLNNFQNQISNTIKDVTKTSFIEQIVIGELKHVVQNNDINFYTTLIYPRVQLFNQSINKDVCSNLQKYMKFLKEGAKIDESFNMRSYDLCQTLLQKFENTIIDIVSSEIVHKKYYNRNY